MFSSVGGGGRAESVCACVCLCQRFETEATGARCCMGHAYLCSSTANFPCSRVPRLRMHPTLSPCHPTPRHTVSPKIMAQDDPLMISSHTHTHTTPPLTLSLCHSILITLIKSFVHLEISDDNLFHSTLQQWWL